MIRYIIIFTISINTIAHNHFKDTSYFKDINFNKMSTKGIKTIKSNQISKFPKGSTANYMNADKATRRVSEAHKLSQPYFDRKNILQKNTCPPVGTAAVNDADYEDCAKNVKEAVENFHPDQLKLTTAILETYGYPFKKYKVTTQDDYILTVYRIVGTPRLEQHKAHKTPIYINHGLGGASDFWFFHPPEKTMVFMMADRGYDVWLGNARGSTYSLEHETLDYKKNLSYWDFSFHEMGIYDVPAVTNLILKETGQKNTLYLGYSMGTTELLISLSEIPEMSNKIRAAFLLAPIANIGHASNSLRNIATIIESENAFQALNSAFNGKIHGNVEALRLLKICNADICVPSAAKCGLCDNAFYAISGVNALQMNRSALPLFFDKCPNIVSIKTITHFSQLIVSCRFQKFDYSPSTNLKLYGNLRPSVYDVKKIQSPIYVYHSEQDNMGVPLDVYDTFRRLKPGVVKKITMVDDELFTHIDFVMAKDADKLVYKGLLNDMQQHIENT